MDTTAPPIRSKRRKLLRRRADASCDKDLISKFPEDILVHILSFLSTQEAIRTSILSKRWKYLWQSSPKFFFLDPSLAWPSRKKRDDIEDLEATFYGSIERAVTLRNCSCLVELSLVLGAQVAATQLQSWLSAAQKHEVQKLILCLPKHGEIILPDSLFTAKSLGSFWLETSCTLKVPSFICFSSLKILSLVNVVFEDDQSTQNLLSGCPLLERLHLVDCDWGNIVTISIENPTLRSLTFSDRLYPYHFSNAKIMISALNLETICVAGRLRVELLLCNLPSLKSASIDIQKWSEGQQTVKLLTGLKHVKTLNLSTETLEFLFGGGNLIGQLPTFVNVTYLKAYMRSPYYYTTNKDHASGALLYILQKSPNVEFLEVPKVLIREEQHMISKPTNILSSRKESIVCDVRRNEYAVRN